MSHVEPRRPAVRTFLLATFTLFAAGVLWNGLRPKPPTLKFDCGPNPGGCTDHDIDTEWQKACDKAFADGTLPPTCEVSFFCGPSGAQTEIKGRHCDCDMAMAAGGAGGGGGGGAAGGGGGGGGGASNPLTLTDSMGRFAAYAVPSVTCMNDPSYGNTVSAPVPQSIVTALGLTAVGTYTFMFYSGSFNNVLILGPPPMGTIYYNANHSGLTIPTSGMSGSLPSTTMNGNSGATGMITAAGDFTCP